MRLPDNFRVDGNGCTVGIDAPDLRVQSRRELIELVFGVGRWIQDV